MSDVSARIRLNKLMAQRGLCSRREADALIAAGKVRVDGQTVASQGEKVLESSLVEIIEQDKKWSLLLNKPNGYVSHLPQAEQLPAFDIVLARPPFSAVEKEVMDHIRSHASKFAVAGRLDRASRGLLIFSEDGRVIRALTHEHQVEKSYRVKVGGRVEAETIERLRGPLRLDGQKLRPMRVESMNWNTLEFGLMEGRKHHIRRICRQVGLNVIDLCRTAIGTIHIDTCPEGEWRLLNARELEEIFSPSGGEL